MPAEPVRREAFAFAREFTAAPPSELSVDRHYLLCASRGALRLEAHGKVWLLPPARAALIAAGEPIQVAIPQPVTTSSVLFDPGFAPEPSAPLTVFDLTPLARALVTECVEWPDGEEPLPPYARSMFGALAAVAWRLAEQPSTVTVPAGRSPELRRALALTDDGLADELRFDDIAREVGLAPRSLARRFEDECGMTWSAVLRRMRVLRAIEKLATNGNSVTMIAHSVGYTSLSAFNVAFRDLTGRTPTQYRQTFRP
jgi:AraC-like DNA-binding protein